MNSFNFSKPELSILLVTPQLEIGGAEKQVIIWAKALQERGLKVGVVSSGGPLLVELEQADIVHYHLPMQSRSLLQILRNGLALRRLLKKHPANILHAQSPTVALACRIALLGTKGKVVTTVHLITPQNRRATVPLLKIATDLTLTCSRQMRDELIKLGMPQKRVKAYPNSVDLKFFQSSVQSISENDPKLEFKKQNRPIVITVARLEPDKGHRFLLSAIALMKEKQPELKPLFLIVGDGSTRPALEIQIKELKLESDVLLLGKRNDVPNLLAQADLFVLPSLREGLPLAIIEAMGAGLAVIASAVDGVPELVEDKVTGRLVKPGEVSALAEAVVEMLQNPSLAQIYGQNGREKALNDYYINRSIEKLIEIYQNLLSF